MDHVFIINPAAGKGREQISLQQRIKSFFEQSDLSWEIYQTKGVGDAITYVKKRCQSSNNIRFYACGGDGTLNEVVNGAVGFAQASVTVVPCGTGNDFIRNFSSKTGFTDIAALVQAEDRLIDLIKVNQRWTVNECNVGFDAAVAYNMDRFKRIPLVQGSMAYTIAVFYSFFHKISYQLDIQIDDQPYISKDFLLLLLANGSHYGGGYNGAPTAMVDDGLLDFFGFFGLNRFQIIGLLNKYKLGLHMTEEKLKSKMIFRQGCNVKIRAREDVPVCIDGDIFLAKELEISLVPGCLRFAVPR